MPVEDAEARMATQASRDERLAVADEVVANDAGLDALARRVDELWTVLAARAGSA
jgi:dephospho-CoA kinase